MAAASAVACADPCGVANQLCEVMRELKLAMVAAKVNADTCNGIVDTVVSAIPVVVKLLAIGSLYAGEEAELNAALDRTLRACVQAAEEACHAVYRLLQYGLLKRLANASDVEKLLTSKHRLLRDRLQDMNLHISLATHLHVRGAEQQLREVADSVAGIKALQVSLANRLPFGMLSSSLV